MRNPLLKAGFSLGSYKRAMGLEPTTLSLGSKSDLESAGSGGTLRVEYSHVRDLPPPAGFPFVPVCACQ